MLEILQFTEEEIEGAWSGACCIAILLLFFVWIYICIWVYRDAEKRGSSGILWAILVFFFGVIPLIVWLLARPPIRQSQYGAQGYGYMPPPPTSAYQQCPSCGQAMALVPQYNRYYCYNCGKYQDDFVHKPVTELPCPYCGKQNGVGQRQCTGCGARINER